MTARTVPEFVAAISPDLPRLVELLERFDEPPVHLVDQLAVEVKQSTSGRTATRLFLAKEAQEAKKDSATFADRVRPHLISLPSLNSQAEKAAR